MRRIEGQRGDVEEEKSRIGRVKTNFTGFIVCLESVSSTSNCAGIKRSWGLRCFCHSAASTGATFSLIKGRCSGFIKPLISCKVA